MRVVNLTSDEFEEHRDNYDGFCKNCEEWTDGGVEPDGRDYLCKTVALAGSTVPRNS